jgi:hypothetical protein
VRARARGACSCPGTAAALVVTSEGSCVPIRA